MDLTSVTNKLQAGHYRDRFQFKDDIELIFRNAKTYTPDPKAWIHYEASRSEAAFRQQWSRITKTLEQAAARAAAAAKPRDDEEAPEEPSPRVTLKIKRPAQDDGEGPRKRTIKISLRGDSEHRSREGTRQPSEGFDTPEPAEPPAEQTDTAAESPPAPEPAPAPRKIGLKIKRSKPAMPAPEAQAEEAQDTPGPPAEPPAAASPAPCQPESASNDEAPHPEERETPLQPKKVRAVLQAMMKQKEGVIFLRPIDPVLDGAPTYYDEIKHPMDLGTVDRKFKNGEYATMGDFADDVRLIFSNCRQFNPPGTLPRVFEAAVSKTWRREWTRAMVRKLSYQGKRALQSMLNRLKQHPSGGLFLYAVDPCV